MRLTDRATVQALMQKHNLHFQKKYGQNFLVNPTVLTRIAEHAAPGVLEIGPGIGSLTRELCSVAERVVAVEIDRALIPVLAETLADFSNVKVINEDVLKLDLGALLREEFGDLPVSVCANLPYYITTPIIMALLESHLPFREITVMIQKEVADRLCATAGSGLYGAVTAAVSYYARVVKRFDVAPGNFVPAPKVTSTVISIIPHETPPVSVPNEALLFSVIRAAFGQRRKTLQNALSAGLPYAREQIARVIADCGLSPTVRGECLSLAEFAALATAFAAI